jgi:hypothetical protein
VWVAGAVVLLGSLALPAATFPENDGWLRRFQTPELRDGHTVGQEFVMTRDHLDAIEVRPVATDARRSGDVRVALVDITGGLEPRVVRSGVLRVDDFDVESPYRFSFAPIPDSRNHRYRFELTADGSRGVALLATKGDPYGPGPLTFNGRSRWADLVFQASAPTRSIWQVLWTGRTQSGVDGKVILALLIVSWIATGFLFRAVASVPSLE